MNWRDVENKEKPGTPVPFPGPKIGKIRKDKSTVAATTMIASSPQQSSRKEILGFGGEVPDLLSRNTSCVASTMEYKRPQPTSRPKIKPRLIIHGGAGNIKPTNLTPERYQAVRKSMLGMVSSVQPCSRSL